MQSKSFSPMSNSTAKELTAQQIKWAWAKCVVEKPQEALMEAIPLICAEVMRTDEIGMITAGGRQIAIIYHLEKREPCGWFNMMASQDFYNVSWDHLFDFLQLSESNENVSVVSGFELLLYRPGRGQLYTPLKYTSYAEAVQGCDRHLFFLVNVLHTPETGSMSCLVQVKRSVLDAVLERKLKVGERTIVEAIDDWLRTVYDEASAERRYKALSCFPLAQPPADSDDLAPVTTVQLNAAAW